ncbi:MAG: DNA/RNA nuclease SfsA [Clostridia bacterium]|nr:DNA/RNA nuclease SfsA [Clostridia bacterium]
MRYPNIHLGRFLRRPNRFIAHVELDGQEVVCHVKNTGRCRELLVPGAAVWLCKSDNPARKTAYDLVAVQKGDLLINMDSAAPNAVFGEFARAGKFLPDTEGVKSEVRYGASRFDFCITAGGQTHYVEVKGVTLEEAGVVRFPDAPTERGVRHLRELMDAKAAGYGAHAVFVIQMERAGYFTPNERTHPAFAVALREAAEAGVQVHAYTCRVTSDGMEMADPVPVVL